MQNFEPKSAMISAASNSALIEKSGKINVFVGTSSSQRYLYHDVNHNMLCCVATCCDDVVIMLQHILIIQKCYLWQENPLVIIFFITWGKICPSRSFISLYYYYLKIYNITMYFLINTLKTRNCTNPTSLSMPERQLSWLGPLTPRCWPSTHWCQPWLTQCNQKSTPRWLHQHIGVDLSVYRGVCVCVYTQTRIHTHTTHIHTHTHTHT